MNLKKWTLGIVATAVSMMATAQEYMLQSPDGKTTVRILVKDSIQYSVLRDGKVLLQPATISLSTSFFKSGVWKPSGSKKTAVQQVLQPVVPQKSSHIVDHYAQLQIGFKNQVDLQWRAYNNGVAWRWVIRHKGEYEVISEKAGFALQPKDTAWYPVEDGFYSHNERLYRRLTVDELRDKNKLGSLPALFSAGDKKLLITESGLLNYAGMWLEGTGTGNVAAVFPHYPSKLEITSDRDEVVRSREPYIARENGAAQLPWRIVMIAAEDKELLTNQLAYQLAVPSTGDYSWVKPGKASWDWWNANNVYGVDFRAGINTATYKYYVDFAAKYGLEYIILDEGWSDTRNLLKTIPDIDMEALSAYAASKNVGIILWTSWVVLDQQLDAALDLFAKWGIKGIKVDFMQRDDQVMVNYYERVAKAAAARKILVDFHGAYKPAGLQRTYPNVLSFEGVYGMEQNKVDQTKSIAPPHNVTFPFIRMAAGPVDFTPGAMLNAQPGDWAPHWSSPMSIGTRCHQLAMFVIYESPLQMLADNPVHYYKEPECMEFLQHVPAVWDTTIALQAQLGEYILTARKALNGDWYVGGMTGTAARTLTLDCSFLGEGAYELHIWKDGINADRNAQDFKVEQLTINKNSKIPVAMTTGGGWAARIIKR
ncbi:glycoside hydrolase family 97 protein [Chitinophaga defluvii]|uniref:Glycoside hydrolase family 97 protein n=1 Tax=Chitinophaga defluvii TaxID=3163343 RepID=A0ABV2TBN3_9BACT